MLGIASLLLIHCVIARRMTPGAEPSAGAPSTIGVGTPHRVGREVEVEVARHLAHAGQRIAGLQQAVGDRDAPAALKLDEGGRVGVVDPQDL